MVSCTLGFFNLNTLTSLWDSRLIHLIRFCSGVLGNTSKRCHKSLPQAYLFILFRHKYTRSCFLFSFLHFFHFLQISNLYLMKFRFYSVIPFYLQSVLCILGISYKNLTKPNHDFYIYIFTSSRKERISSKSSQKYFFSRIVRFLAHFPVTSCLSRQKPLMYRIGTKILLLRIGQYLGQIFLGTIKTDCSSSFGDNRKKAKITIYKVINFVI